MIVFHVNFQGLFLHRISASLKLRDNKALKHLKTISLGLEDDIAIWGISGLFSEAVAMSFRECHTRL